MNVKQTLDKIAFGPTYEAHADHPGALHRKLAVRGRNLPAVSLFNHFN
jgi:hypothetical protein